ncbi:hypothetical protein Dcar01_01831 [Deinococcus carri]|uniref:TniQ domain-containing protein n=1 Tax=Deinococcus carri TaxID=1211323 RepID=A0ABP9W6V3_9DEIO
MSVRPLSICIAPRQGESFSSYVSRLSFDLQVPVLTTLFRTGVIDAEEVRALNAGYGVVLSPRRLGAFARATRLEDAEVAALLLSRYDGGAIDLSGIDAADAASIHRVASREWAYFSGTHLCPECLLEDQGVWQLAWKLPWSFACPRHGCLLVDTCPSCRRRIGAARQDGGSRPLFTTQGPSLYRCLNARPPGEAATGRAAGPCGGSLTGIHCDPLTDWPVLLQAQHEVWRLLSGATRVLPGGPSAKNFFKEMRSLCALLLYAAELADLGSVPPVSRDAFLHVLDERAHRLAHAGRRIGERARGAHTHVYAGAPTSAALMAALVPAALSILHELGTEAPPENLCLLVERAAERCGGYKYVRRLPTFFSFTPRFLLSFKHCLPRESGLHRGLRRVFVSREPSAPNFQVRHIPQLLWGQVFTFRFARLLPGVHEDYARRFCSMALVKASGGHSWGDAARHLQLPVEQAMGLANKCSTLLSSRFQVPQFESQMNDLLTELNRGIHHCDYQERRRLLRDFEEIEHSDWMGICRAADVPMGKRGGKVRFASVWLWSRLTEGDYRLAPGMGSDRALARREMYRLFCANYIDPLRPTLMDYARNKLGLLELHMS